MVQGGGYLHVGHQRLPGARHEMRYGTMAPKWVDSGIWKKFRVETRFGKEKTACLNDFFHKVRQKKSGLGIWN
jgi:hypothetical protein